MYISVIGGAECDNGLAEMAYEVGKLVAEQGAILVCGGLTGVMDAAARGAKDGGGISVGILPTETREGASPHLTVALPTGIGYARNALVAQAGDVVIAVGGEYGTLSEIGFALNVGKPVVGLYTWQLKKPGQLLKTVIEVQTPEEAVAKAFELASR